MARTDARCEKILEDREVWHLRVRSPDNKSQGLYLKKHHVRSWVSKLRALLGIRPAPTPARIEARNVAALSAQGIAVMRLIAYGERLRSDGLQESFVISEELENYAELHHYLRRRFVLSPLGAAPSAITISSSSSAISPVSRGDCTRRVTIIATCTAAISLSRTCRPRGGRSA